MLVCKEDLGEIPCLWWCSFAGASIYMCVCEGGRERERIKLQKEREKERQSERLRFNERGKGEREKERENMCRSNPGRFASCG